MSDLIQIEQQPWMRGEAYYRYTCSKCGEDAQDTYVEPVRTHMRDARLCYTCNHWNDFDTRLAADHGKLTIIDGAIYTPGNNTSGQFRGMAGRRFDIEYIEPSAYAGQRATTFDLWTGGGMPDWLQKKYADTAVFLNGAERCQVGETGCWNPSDNKTEPYPLPIKLIAKASPTPSTDSEGEGE
jgi:hypothetical protein